MQFKEVHTNDYLTKSNLPYTDYVINPYGGCTHACKYCYASFMKRFTGHTEEWGSFLDIKRCDKPISAKKLTGKTVFLASVTDPYNAAEKKYKITRGILEQLKDIDCYVKISTKSSLIQRDLELLKQFPHLTVDMSINTLDENFRRDMDRGSSIEERLRTLKLFHENGIETVLFMSPCFPGITDFREIIEASVSFIDEYWFENLNLRGDYKQRILAYIHEKYPQLDELYQAIYMKNNETYWFEMERDFTQYCEDRDIRYVNAFYHSKLVAEKVGKS